MRLTDDQNERRLRVLKMWSREKGASRNENLEREGEGQQRLCFGRIDDRTLEDLTQMSKLWEQ